eukprot:6201641-Pleurochrysis_carterae.AAC.8
MIYFQPPRHPNSERMRTEWIRHSTHAHCVSLMPRIPSTCNILGHLKSINTLAEHAKYDALSKRDHAMPQNDATNGTKALIA